MDLVAEKVGNVKEFLIANGVVEPLDAEVVASTEVLPDYIPGKEFVSEKALVGLSYEHKPEVFQPVGSS